MICRIKHPKSYPHDGPELPDPAFSTTHDSSEWARKPPDPGPLLGESLELKRHDPDHELVGPGLSGAHDLTLLGHLQQEGIDFKGVFTDPFGDIRDAQAWV